MIDFVSEGENMNKLLEKLECMTAEELINTYGIRLYPDVNTMNIDDIYGKMGIGVFHKNLSGLEKETGIKDIEGFVISDEEFVGIFINKKLSKPRKRFIQAFLLGICCCTDYDNGYELQYIKSSNDDITDLSKKAVAFAKELLMPVHSMMAVTKRLLMPYLSVYVQIFEVEPKLAAERLENLRLAYYKDMFWDRRYFLYEEPYN